MRFRRWAVVLFVLLLWPLCAVAQDTGVSRALLIGVDEFVSRPSAYPSSANNVQAMQQLFAGAGLAQENILSPQVVTAKALENAIASAFGSAQDGDVSYLYISTHGVYQPESGQPPVLLLSDGVIEDGVTPAQLEAAFDDVKGHKVLILDACNSGAFIGKGMAQFVQEVHFLGDDFKVLTSSGALEESWYWSAGQDMAGQGAFYFTQALCEGLSARSGYPADRNSDGAVTMDELYDYLLLSHAASTPQVYPQNDDFVFFRYDPHAPLASAERSPVMDVTFSGTTLSRDSRQIAIEFIATRPVRVAYQIVYQRDGKWQFDTAQLIYDQAERFTAFGDQPGAISAGRKLRTVNLSRIGADSHGYVLVQLVSIDEGRLTVHAGRVICVPPGDGEMQLTASVDEMLTMSSGRELSIFIGHDYPCTLSVAIVDENEKVIHRICHRQSTRPMQITPAGSVFYWDGTLKDGSKAPAGVYRVRAQAHMNDTAVTVLSSAFTIQ
ncbi:MAG: caspase family protein [Clostridia bacterium]|nr:caspase family protein [Clostridia bacterium]